MNWARDNTGLDDADLETVFKYAPRESTVIRMLARDNWNAEISSFDSEKQWKDWIDNELPSAENGGSGLILLLAKRCGEPSLRGIQKTTSDDWLERARDKTPVPGVQRASAFSPLGEKVNIIKDIPKPSFRRGVRTVPFGCNTFGSICRGLHIHGSIARVISRTDVPAFTCEKVLMGAPAYIYNCRSSNAWGNDLALTVTHYPNTGLTFAILFGCSFDTEKEIVTRLSYVGSEAAHPLLLPGIFAEIERVRHVRIVEETVNNVEAQIFRLDHQSLSPSEPQGEEAQARSQEKRSAYLDLAYLRNALVSWNTQLEKMARHSQELIRKTYEPTTYGYRAPRRGDLPLRSLMRQRSDSELLSSMRASSGNDPNAAKILDQKDEGDSDPQDSPTSDKQRSSATLSETMREVGRKVTSRIMVIMDEYDDKIRDCTMRVDGMAMSTQWAQGETNVEIALATHRDSRHMRSIALVTMIFLPGTFFGTFFSMTFFNWSGNGGSPSVSNYVWIYVLVTAIFTVVTLGMWYYLVVWRPKYEATTRKDDES
ncbi:hypothetical protein CC80DRAFT_599444 [Byssothecium circinans]|uniref:Cora-domain-containing protein n=1 Tax=Byssothecium circinans TaxID=147558 RepID=A0A6A5TAN6_9PLEO|nr:hypothetical protein CC80DRAFT_599444 [Byssothecium circinans]